MIFIYTRAHSEQLVRHHQSRTEAVLCVFVSRVYILKSSGHNCSVRSNGKINRSKKQHYYMQVKLNGVQPRIQIYPKMKWEYGNRTNKCCCALKARVRPVFLFFSPFGVPKFSKIIRTKLPFNLCRFVCVSIFWARFLRKSRVLSLLPLTPFGCVECDPFGIQNDTSSTATLCVCFSFSYSPIFHLWVFCIIISVHLNCHLIHSTVRVMPLRFFFTLS